MNVGESDVGSVLGPAENKARSVSSSRKPALKTLRKVEKASAILHSSLSLSASFSSDCSTDSFRSRASTGRIGSLGVTRQRKLVQPSKEQCSLKGSIHGVVDASQREYSLKKTCSWVTPNIDPLYAAFRDEEWGVPVHDDKKLFELLVLSSALGELTWPQILNKRHIFREVFADFDLVAVSMMNKKRITVSPASGLLSEPKLRAAVENAPQIIKAQNPKDHFFSSGLWADFATPGKSP
ncbi:DNA glycosylase superfamily protein isoform X2 [Wolffia australiana]